MNTDLKEIIIEKLSTGNAILFTGAGFSLDLKSINNQHPLEAKELSKKICELIGIDIDEDLQFTSDYCIKKTKKVDELIYLLKDFFSIKSVSEETNTICSIKWRRFYTTNYDRGIEIALANNGKKYQTIGIDFEVGKFIRNENPCIHLNGVIDNLSRDSLNTTFKLSNSSYVDSDLASSPNWRYFFQEDLDKCSAIIFIGYSLYDMDIKKLLHENEELKQKTFFITPENISEKEKFQYGEYGTIIKIGKKGFAEVIRQNNDRININKLWLNNFEPFSEKLFIEKDNIKDIDIQDFLFFGKNQESMVASISLNMNKDASFAINRTVPTQQILDMLYKGENVIIHSNYGNGKTCLLFQIAAKLFQAGKEVYFLSKDNVDYFEELKALSQTTAETKYIIIDNCIVKKDFFKSYLMLAPNNIQLICADRTEILLNYYDDVFNNDNSFKIFPFDNLNGTEIHDFISLVDFIGLWGDRAGDSIDRKSKFLEGQNGYVQLSSALLKLFEAPQIQDRIHYLIRDLLKSCEIKNTIFSICYLKIIGLQPTELLISLLSDSFIIYESTLIRNVYFKQLFLHRSNHIDISNAFAIYLLNNYFNGEYILSRLQFFVKKFNRYSNRVDEQQQVFRSALRFHIVDTILPDKSKKILLLQYYEQLKRLLKWLLEDPNYWMQYAMAKMICGEFEDAQNFLNTAYSVAKGKIMYNTTKLDNQQARLYLLIAQKKHNASEIFNYFTLADNILRNTEMDFYALHRIEEILDFYVKCFSKLSTRDSEVFLKTIKRYQAQLERYEGSDKYQYEYLYLRVIDRIKKILETENVNHK